MSNRLRILLADDHVLFLDAFRLLLQTEFLVVGVVHSGHGMVRAALSLRPDIILAEIEMPGLNGLDACEQLRKKIPETKVIFLTANEDAETACDAIRRGAYGYIHKREEVSELFKAIARVRTGRVYISPLISQEPTGVFIARANSKRRLSQLTPRQREVLQSLAEGKSMKEAADVLKITPRTIAFHKYRMMDQLGIRTGAQLVRYAAQAGLVGSGRNDAT